MLKRTQLHHAIDTMRTMSLASLKENHFGTRAGDVLLVAVAIGDAELRPMTAGKIATYIGMPRPTAVRRLAAMEHTGLVERDARRRYVLTPEGRRQAAKASSAA